MMWFEPGPYTILVDEGRVYGARYYTAHPTTGANWNDMMTWMIDTFGPTSADGVWSPGYRWYANNARFWFRNQEDLTVFLLRWQQ